MADYGGQRPLPHLRGDLVHRGHHAHRHLLHLQDLLEMGVSHDDQVSCAVHQCNEAKKRILQGNEESLQNLNWTMKILEKF